MLKRTALMLALAFTPQTLGDESPIKGFTEAGAEAQRLLEAEFDSYIHAEDLQGWMHELAAEPHHAGSEHGRRNVETMRRLFTEWGYETAVASYDVLLPTPNTRRLEMQEPHPFVASLAERSVEGDESSASPDLLPPYNSFSPDGDVTAELVYVNYGTREDHELLARHGVSLKGKIAIVRYGRIFRGLKPKMAAEYGAIGCIMYSDPADDGYVRGEVYPVGGYKNDSGVQRGSVMDLALHTGDLLTPGWAAVAGAERLARDEAPAMAPIPTLPISYADAQPLLDAIEGEIAPAEWRGGLPITYRIGPGPAKVRLTVRFDWNTVTASNVVARLDGAVWPDQWVMRGNHHDGWNHGAADPLSGIVALLAEAQAIAKLDRRPARTVLFAAWDSEEHGLMGSTEWAEENAEELREKLVLYSNTDGMSRGFVRIGGSPSLAGFFNEVQRDVKDPQTGLSVGDRSRARIQATGDEAARKELESSGRLPMGALGSGSDYTPFLQHLGIASANLSIGGEGRGSSYHTRYDTIEHYERFVDPGYTYGVVLAQVAGRTTLRMANARLLPFDFGEFATAVKDYLADLEQLAHRKRQQTARNNRLITSGQFAAALDPTRALAPPPKRAPVPHFNFAPIHNALAALDAAVAEQSATASMDDATLERINEALHTAERLLTREEGLPGRPWYRHQIYAPGRDTGYGAKTLPWVREAIEHRRYEDVPAGVEAIAARIDALAERMRQVAELAKAP